MRCVSLAILKFVLLPAVSFSSSSIYSLEQQMLVSKKKIAFELSQTIAHCVSRQDTDHITFKGCIDWHSSVHGVWALIAFMRATGEKSYDNLIRQILAPEKIEGEHTFLQNNPDFEMPYGRAWFLRLAIEYSRYTGNNDLKGMADDLLNSLLTYYEQKKPDPRSGSYDSASWALINMLDYSMHIKDIQVQKTITEIIRQNFVIDHPECAFNLEYGAFMAVCTNWAWLVSRILPKEQFNKWHENFVSLNGLPSPVVKPVSWHHYGLNFSRAWGLWELYRATSDKRYARLYFAHFRATYERPVSWRGSYRGVAHWVPQFGMFALQPLFGENGR